MQIHKSPPSASVFSELKEILALISDPKKTAEAVSAIQQEISYLEELKKSLSSKQESFSLRETAVLSLEKTAENKTDELLKKEAVLNQKEKFLVELEHLVQKADLELAFRVKNFSDEKSKSQSDWKLKLNWFDGEKRAIEETRKELNSAIEAHHEKVNRLKAFIG